MTIFLSVRKEKEIKSSYIVSVSCSQGNPLRMRQTNVYYTGAEIKHDSAWMKTEYF